jgi:molybdate transport system ATP-binding protein
MASTALARDDGGIMIQVEVEKRLGHFHLAAAFTAGAGVTALFGPSGSGKSTIVKAISGLIAPEKGLIKFGDDIMFDGKTNVSAQKRRAGVVFQDGRLFPHLTVRDNLMYGFRRAAGERKIGFDDVVAVLGISGLLARCPATLSGGERQRVAVGRALLSQPRLLLMDEPLASLDRPRKAEVLPFLASLNSRFAIPILYVTHDTDEVLELASDVVLLAGGRVAVQGPLADVTSRLDLPPEAETLGLGAVLSGTIAEQDAARGLTTIATAAGSVRLALIDRPIGSAIAIRIAARDVALALIAPSDISVQNILPVSVQDIRRVSPYVVRLALKSGDARLLAEITEDARFRLALEPGVQAFALIKSIAIAA